MRESLNTFSKTFSSTFRTCSIPACLDRVARRKAMMMRTSATVAATTVAELDCEMLVGRKTMRRKGLPYPLDTKELDTWSLLPCVLQASRDTDLYIHLPLHPLKPPYFTSLNRLPLKLL